MTEQSATVQADPIMLVRDVLAAGDARQAAASSHLPPVPGAEFDSGAQPVDLRVILQKRDSKGTVMFWQVRDETGDVQVMLEKNHPSYEEYKSFHAKSRLRIRGAVDVSNSGRCQVLAESVERLTRSEPEAYLTVRSLPRVNTVAQVYLARLERHFADGLRSAGYTEITTRSLSTRPPSVGLEPFKVLYEGYGEPFYIAPSPARQLIQGLVDSHSYDRLFTVSRCYTQTYRDPYVSTEALVLCAVALDDSLLAALRQCYQLVLALFASGSTRPRGSVPGPLRLQQYSWPEMPPTAAVEEPTVQMMLSHPAQDGEELMNRRRVEGDPSVDKNLGRLCWPVIDGRPGQEYVLAEGFEYMPREGERVGMTCFTLSVERMLGLLLTQTDFRRIPELGD